MLEDHSFHQLCLSRDGKPVGVRVENWKLNCLWSSGLIASPGVDRQMEFSFNAWCTPLRTSVVLTQTPISKWSGILMCAAQFTA